MKKARSNPMHRFLSRLKLAAGILCVVSSTASLCPAREALEKAPVRAEVASITHTLKEWETINPVPGVFNFEAADQYVRFASSNLASRYSDLFGVYLKHRGTVTRVTLWGLSDGTSWPIKGRTNHPLLFDRAFQPKPAFEAVIQKVSQ